MHTRKHFRSLDVCGYASMRDYLLTPFEEGVTHVRIYQEVDQDHSRNDHPGYNERYRGMSRLGEFKTMSHQANHLNDYCQPEGPALEKPEPQSEDECEQANDQGNDRQDNSY